MVMCAEVMINVVSSLSSLSSPTMIVIVTAGWQGEAGRRLVATQAERERESGLRDGSCLKVSDGR